MIVYDSLEQGSPAWLNIRLGVPTTSRFGDIITPKGAKAKPAADYMNELLGQLLAGKVEPFFKSKPMQRGNDLEPEAVAYYEKHHSVKTREVGFVTTNDGRIGCSPDRLVGRDGLLEVKCPMYKQHVKNLRSGVIDTKYIPQVQGQMLLTGRKWCDWISYHPDMASSIVRVELDEEYQANLKEYLTTFVHEMDEVIDMLKQRGCPFHIEVRPIQSEWD